MGLSRSCRNPPGRGGSPDVCIWPRREEYTGLGKYLCEGSLGVLGSRLKATLESVFGGSGGLCLVGKLSSGVMFLFFSCVFPSRKGLCLFLFFLFCLLIKQTWCSGLGLRRCVLVEGKESLKAVRPGGRQLQLSGQVLGRAEEKPGMAMWGQTLGNGG